MSSDFPSATEQRHRRIRVLKRLLRFLPRRSNIRRYPVLKWFPNLVRKRAYLWSFKPAPVISALYAGWTIALLPIYGIQLFVGLIAALVLRANLPIMYGLICVTNPFTFVPIYYFTYLIGDKLMCYWGITSSQTISPDDIQYLFVDMTEKIFHFFIAMTLGGLLIAYIAALLSSLIFRVFMSRFR